MPIGDALNGALNLVADSVVMRVVTSAYNPTTGINATTNVDTPLAGASVRKFESSEVSGEIKLGDREIIVAGGQFNGVLPSNRVQIILNGEQQEVINVDSRNEIGAQFAVVLFHVRGRGN